MERWGKGLHGLEERGDSVPIPKHRAGRRGGVGKRGGRGRELGGQGKYGAGCSECGTRRIAARGEVTQGPLPSLQCRPLSETELCGATSGSSRLPLPICALGQRSVLNARAPGGGRGPTGSGADTAALMPCPLSAVSSILCPLCPQARAALKPRPLPSAWPGGGQAVGRAASPAEWTPTAGEGLACPLHCCISRPDACVCESSGYMVFN